MHRPGLSFAYRLFSAHATDDEPLSVALLEPIVIAADRRDVNIDVGFHNDHPRRDVSGRARVKNDDLVVAVAIVPAQGLRIVGERLWITRPRLLESCGNDATDVRSSTVDHLVVPKHRTFLI